MLKRPKLADGFQGRAFFFFFKFSFLFKLYIIVLALPNIKMNPPQVYMCSPEGLLKATFAVRVAGGVTFF